MRIEYSRNTIRVTKESGDNYIADLVWELIKFS